MCTVTFFPTDEGYILTSNRDEHISRKPSKEPTLKDGVLFPQDGEAGGTWVGANENGRVLCLLNGAFIKHERKETYRKSRGIIVLELFHIETLNVFTDNYSLRNIEPFTIIWIESNPKVSINEIRWDGKNKHVKILESSNPHIWSSSTLYNKDISNLREEWFSDFLEDIENVDHYELFQFHKNAGAENVENNVRMKRPDGVQTVSTTQVHYENNTIQLMHQNYVTTKVTSSPLKLIFAS